MIFKPYLKALTKKDWFQNAISRIAASYMQFVYKTVRWEFKNPQIVDVYTHNKRPLIACFWHNRLGLMRYAWKSDMPFNMLISGHADGKIIARTTHRLGIQTIEGSSSKGGSDATRKILRALKKGEGIGVTPDGPRGPRYSVNKGLIQLAQIAEADLLPVSYSLTNRIIWKSWDGMMVPLPFGRGVFVYGDPISVSKTSDTNHVTGLLRERLIETSNESDIIIGNPIIPEPNTRETA